MKLRSNYLKENITGYLFILPQMIVFLAFLVYPILEGMRLSLYQINYDSEKFVGFANYTTLFNDPVFLRLLSTPLCS